ncbi:6067_t:CDS:2 [Cetraspora pellucida]|uniref:NOL1/NOP2/Sun domain family member 4 n=1 Tax=Cetraspora pellucida TaxID=1433469 RepID=A0A9N9B1X3_9GLOM|nr:6067_t:CDS:2 [Cetraspora pellucida]
MGSNEKPCRNCEALRAQLEQKEAIVDKYQKIVQSQNELLQDLTQKSPFASGSSRKQSENFGHFGTSSSFDLNSKVTAPKTRGKQDGIDKETLKKCLEDAFGAVENIDMIPSKACAFADFATQTAYHAAVSEGPKLIKSFCSTRTLNNSKQPQPIDSEKFNSLSKNKKKLVLKHSLHHSITLSQFSSFYSSQYGQDRWQTLFQSLQNPTKYCALVNKFASPKHIQSFLSSTPVLEQVSFLDLPCYISSERFKQPEKDENGIMNYYLLDAASIMVVKALDLNITDVVLDLCAAPGGKSLVILQYLLSSIIHDDNNMDYGFLTANDLSPNRCRLDAPCSAERHLLHSPSEFLKWKPSRSKIMSQKQYKMLLDAVKGIHVGGLLVYVTCSINKFENEEVVKKILRNSWVPLEEVKREWVIGEPCEKGWIVLPDKCDGWGPLYFAILRRVGEGEFRKKERKRFKRFNVDKNIAKRATMNEF